MDFTQRPNLQKHDFDKKDHRHFVTNGTALHL